MTLHLYAQNPRKTIPRLENLAPKQGQDIPRSGKRTSDLGKGIPTPEKYASVLGQHIPTSGKHTSDLGKGIPTQEKYASVLGQNVPTSGKHASNLVEEIPTLEKSASVLGHNVPTSELFLPVFRLVFKLKNTSVPDSRLILGVSECIAAKKKKKLAAYSKPSAAS